jgi:hypothetical protein
MVTPSIGTTSVVQHWEQRLHGNSDSSSASTNTIPIGIFSNNESILRELKTKPMPSQDNQDTKGNSSEASFSDTSLLRHCESTDSLSTPKCKTCHDDASSSSSEDESISKEGKKLQEDLEALQNKLRQNRRTGYSSSSDEYSTYDDQETDALAFLARIVDESAHSQSKQIKLRAERREKHTNLEKLNQVVSHKNRTTTPGGAERLI